MSKHKRFALLTREQAVHKRTPDRADLEAVTTVHTVPGPAVLQASRLLGDQLSPAQRRSLIRQLGTVRGNRHLQTLVRGSEAVEDAADLRDQASPAVTIHPTTNAVQLNGRRRSRPKAKTVFRPSSRSYSFKATSLAKAIKAMTAKYGADEWGSCKWYPRPRFSFIKRDGTILSMVLTVRIVITMPRWKDVGKRSQAVQKEWNRFYAALLLHEQGHEKLVRAHLSKLPRSLVGKDRTQAHSDYQAALQALQDASDAYDGQNDHGRKQGTMIDTTIK